MAQPSSIDVIAPFDPTGYVSITGAQLLQFGSGIIPFTDKGMIVFTQDIAGVPQVPDADNETKWQKYLWLRQLAASVRLYVWDSTGVSDVTYLNWVGVNTAGIGPGEITRDMLADLIINSDKVDSIDYSKITGGPAALPLTTKGDLLSNNGVTNVRVGVGTNGQIPTADSTQASGLKWNTVAPNAATDNAVARFDGAAGNPVPVQDSKVVVTDDGAIQASGSGGNARGARAVDLQVSRTVATQVASGVDSVIAGGKQNTASNAFTSVGGGDENAATGTYAAVVGGIQNNAVGSRSTVIGGQNGYAELYGQVAHASGGFEQGGDCQTSEVMLRNRTVGATPAELFLDGAAARLIQRDLVVWSFKGRIVANKEAVSAPMISAVWDIDGMFSKDATGEEVFVTVTLVAACADAVTETWGVAGNVTVTYDAPNESLKIEVTGAAGINLRWCAWLRLVELSRDPTP